ncbi:unnamed protein product [Urochloa humidicola]
MRQHQATRWKPEDNAASPRGKDAFRFRWRRLCDAACSACSLLLHGATKGRGASITGSPTGSGDPSGTGTGRHFAPFFVSGPGMPVRGSGRGRFGFPRPRPVAILQFKAILVLCS